MSSYFHNRWNTPRASVQRLSLKDGRVDGTCDIRDFSSLSPHLHCFCLVARGSLEGGPGSSPDLTPRRHRGKKGQGRGSSPDICACRDCSSTQAPLSVTFQPEAIIVRDPKTAIPHTHGCWKHFATVFICSDVVTECHRDLCLAQSWGLETQDQGVSKVAFSLGLVTFCCLLAVSSGLDGH